MEKKAAKPDEALITQIASRDEDAFAEFVARHHGGLKRFVLSRVRLPSDVDDVIQDTLVAVFRGAASYSGASTPRAWLFGIARNCASRSGRMRVGEPSGFESLELAELGRHAGWGQTSRAEAAVELSELRRALNRLSPEAREVLVLRDIEGMTNPEAAEILGLAIPAIKSRLHRARLALMAEMQEDV